MSKFSKLSSNSKFDEIREALKKKKEEIENKGKTGEEKEKYKFRPILVEGKASSKYIIKLLPNKFDTENIFPWISAHFHMYKRGDGKFIYTLCPTTIEKDAKCPMCEKAKQLFSTKDKADEALARKFYKKLRYFVNVLVKEDPRKGEENQTGQVLIYEFG